MERDRRGGLRVFQGSGLAQSTALVIESGEGLPVEENDDRGNQSIHIETIEAETVGPISVAETDGDAAEILDGESAGIVDTTAELLGRASSRRPRARATTQRKPPAKKAATTRRTSRSKKSSASANDEKPSLSRAVVSRGSPSTA